MGFLAPWFLGATLLAGLPVWLHLLRQHKTTPVQFSSLMFFEKRTTTSTKQRKLRYYALLALRLLALLLLILAFTQPYLERNLPAGGGKRMTIAAIDNSFSMRRTGALEAAKEQALGLAQAVTAGSPGIVLAFGSASREIGQKAEDAGAFRNHVNAVTPGDERTSYAELARVLRGLSEAHRLPLTVHVYTDLQKSGMPPRFADLQLPADAKMELHDVAAQEMANFSVETVTPPGRIFDTAKARVRATVAGYYTPKATKTIELVADGKVLQTKPVEVPENGRASVEFNGLDTGYGFHRGEVRISGGGDSFAADDRFLFSIERSDPRKVLLLHAARDTRSALYVKAALEAAAPNAYQLDAQTFESTSSPSLQNISFVILADPGTLAAPLEASLKEFLAKGGSVWIAAGSATGASSKLALTGLSVNESRLASRAREMFHTVATKEALHPVIEKAAELESVKFYQLISVEPGGSSKVLARTSDNIPVILEQQVGEGRVLLLASPLDNLGNNLPLHPAFVPLVERTSQYLSRQEEATASTLVGGAVELRAAADRATAVEVLDPAGERALSLARASKATTFAPGAEGFYEVRRANGRQSLVAVNADRRESDFLRMEPDTIALWKATGTAVDSATGAANGPRTERSSPWWWLLLFVLIFTLAEGVLASRYLFGSASSLMGEPVGVGSKEAV